MMSRWTMKSHTYNVGLIKYARARKKEKSQLLRVLAWLVSAITGDSLMMVCPWCNSIVSHRGNIVNSECNVCQTKCKLLWCQVCAACMGGTGLKSPAPPQLQTRLNFRIKTQTHRAPPLKRCPAGQERSLAGEASGARPFCTDSVQERGCSSPFSQCHILRYPSDFFWGKQGIHCHT